MKKSQKSNRMPFLPTCRTEMEERGWDELDVLFISGDAYIDLPACSQQSQQEPWIPW